MFGMKRILLRLFLILICLTKELISAAKVNSWLFSKQCDYLPITDTQMYNAYTDAGKLCCLCAAGFKFVGNCNATHPNSTICETCDKNTFMSYSGHKSKKCDPDTGAVCFPPFITIPGTSTRETTCGCPPGQIRDGRSCKKDDAVPTTTTTIATVTVKTTLKTPSTAEISPTTSGKIRQDTNKPEITEQIEEQQVEDLKGETDKNEKEQENGWIMPVAVVVAVALVSTLLLAGLYKNRDRFSCMTDNTSTKQDDSAASSRSASPDGSNAALIPTSRDDALVGNTGMAMVKPSPPRNEAVPFRTEDSVDMSVLELSPPRNEAVPIRDTPQGRCARRQGTIQEVQRLTTAVQGNGLNEGNRQNGVNSNQIESFARAVGKGFGDKFGQKEIAPFYRHLGVSDTDIEDLKKKHENDTAELVYQLTLNAYRKKGSEFNRDFLVQKVHSMPVPQRNLLPVIEHEWNICTRSNI